MRRFMESRGPGYWADHPYANPALNHPYKRHSVAEVEEFVGWGKLKLICEASYRPSYRALPAALFETGTRISEAIQLRRSNFDLSDPAWIRCVDVPIVKQKVSKPFRTFSFPRDEPLFSYLDPYLSGLKSDELLFPFGRNNALKIIYGVGEKVQMKLWAHWFRSQRASQMGAEYEMTENDLMEWFKVKDRNWARRYCKKGDWGLRKVLESNKPLEWRM